jgi:hypothetical protein
MTDPEDTARPGAMLRAKAAADGVPESSIYWLEEENKDEYGNNSTAGTNTGAGAGGGTGELALVSTPESSLGSRLPSRNFKSVHSQSSMGSMSRSGPRHIICAVENDDDDKSHDSWNNLMKVLPRIMEHFLRILRVSVCRPLLLYIVHVHVCLYLRIHSPAIALLMY